MCYLQRFFSYYFTADKVKRYSNISWIENEKRPAEEDQAPAAANPPIGSALPPKKRLGRPPKKPKLSSYRQDTSSADADDVDRFLNTIRLAPSQGMVTRSAARIAQNATVAVHPPAQIAAPIQAPTLAPATSTAASAMPQLTVQPAADLEPNSDSDPAPLKRYDSIHCLAEAAKAAKVVKKDAFHF